VYNLPKKVTLDREVLKQEKETERKTPEDFAADLKSKEKTVEKEGETEAEHDLRVYATEVAELTTLRGVGPKTAVNLCKAGFRSIEDLATARPDEVGALMKQTVAISTGWIHEAAERLLMVLETKTANQQDKDKKARVIFFKTGSPKFNSLLGRYYCPDCYVTRKIADVKCRCCGSTKPTAFIGGGLPTTSISGASGRFASGKTQIGNDIMIDALSKFTCPSCYIQLEEGKKCPKCNKEATPVEVAFIETEPDTFHLDRLKEICGSRHMKFPNFDNIHVCEAIQIPTAKAQNLMYKVIMRKIEAGHNIHLIIVDSFNARFRAGYSRSEMLPIRAREFAEHFNLMESMASRYNLAWYLTCQVIAPPRPDQGLAAKVKFADSYYPVGGDSILHSINNWIGLTQVKTELWEANTFDSSWIPRSSAHFILSERGLMDGLE
jgi:RecA/RadA recombinase/predicted flap endonuclease-1-like 5' DNA nuclease